jgi:hypothetical protein
MCLYSTCQSSPPPWPYPAINLAIMDSRSPTFSFLLCYAPCSFLPSLSCPFLSYLKLPFFSSLLPSHTSIQIVTLPLSICFYFHHLLFPMAFVRRVCMNLIPPLSFFVSSSSEWDSMWLWPSIVIMHENFNCVFKSKCNCTLYEVSAV